MSIIYIFLRNKFEIIMSLLYKFWKKILSNVSKVTFIEFLTLITALGTCWAAWSTFRTIHFIDVTNKTSIKPDLLINDEHMLLLMKRDSNTKYLSLYSTNNHIIDIDTQYVSFFSNPDKFIIKGLPSESNTFEFKVINIGLGTAKNIRITWGFDTVLYLKSLNKVLRLLKCNDQISLHYNNYSINELKSTELIIFSKKDTTVYHDKDFLDVSNQDKYNFLLPYSISKETIKIKIPYSILILYTYYKIQAQNLIHKYFQTVFNDKKCISDSLWPINDFLILNLTIKFEDISNDNFTSNFKILLLGGPASYSSSATTFKTGYTNINVFFRKDD